MSLCIIVCLSGSSKSRNTGLSQSYVIVLNIMVMRNNMLVRQMHWLSWLGLCRRDGGSDSEDEFLPHLEKLLPCRYQLQSDPMPLGSVGGRTAYFVPSYFTLNSFSLTTASRTQSSQMTFILFAFSQDVRYFILYIFYYTSH